MKAMSEFQKYSFHGRSQAKTMTDTLLFVGLEQK